MSIFIIKNGKKILPRSFYVKLLVFWGLIGLSAAVIQPLQALFNQAMNQIRFDFIESFEETAGIEIHYSSIRPAFFNSIDIRNISFLKNGESFLSAARIQAGFSFSELLFNQKINIKTIQIIRPFLHIDLERDMETLDLISSLFSNSDREQNWQITDILQQQAALKVITGTFQVTDGETVYRIDGVNLDIMENDGQIMLNGNAFAEIVYAGLAERTITLKTELGFSGFFDENFEKAFANLNIAYASCYEQNRITRNATFFRPVANTSNSPQILFTISPFSLDLTYEDKVLSINQADEKKAVFYSFFYDIEAGNINAQISLDNFRLSEIIDISDQFTNFERLFSVPVSGNSIFGFENGLINYLIDFKSAGMQDTLPDGFIINVFGDNKAVSVNDFLLASSSFGTLGFFGNVEFSPLRPDGKVFFYRLDKGEKENIMASFNLNSGFDGIYVTSDDIAIGRARIDNLDLFVKLTDRDIDITGSIFTADNGVISIDAIYNINPGEIEASITLDSFSLFEITEILGSFSDINNIPASRSQLQESKINAEIFASTDFNNIIYYAPNFDFNFGNITGNFSLSGSDRQVTLSDGFFRINENEFLSSAKIDFSNIMDLVFSVDAAYSNISWSIEGHILDRSTLIIRDPNGLYIYGTLSSSGALAGYIETVNYPIPVLNRTVYLNMYSAVRYNSLDFWNLDINHLIVLEAGTPANTGEEIFRVSGLADQKGGIFRDIYFRDSTGILLGSANFFWDMDFSYIEVSADLSDGRQETYFFNGVYRDKQISVMASVSNMRLNRFIGGNEPVFISADMTAVWNSIDSFNANVNLTSFNTRMQNDQLSGSVKVNFSNDELIIYELKADLPNISFQLPQLFVNRTNGRARGSFNFEGNAGERRLHGIIGLDVNFMQVDTWLNINEAINKFAGTITVNDIQFGNNRNDEMVFSFSGNEGALSVTGGPRNENYVIRNMLRLEMDSDGNFFAGLSSPFPVHGLIIGTYDKGVVDAYCSNFFIDLQQLYALTSADIGFNIAGGFITGEMTFLGPFWNPQMNGRGTATSMRFQVPDYLGADIRAVPFEILAEGHYMSFGPVVTAVGHGGADVNGWFYFSNWVPVNIGLDISIPRNNPVPYGFNVSGFTAKGDASGHLSLNVDSINRLLEIRGDLFTNEAELGMNMQEMSSSIDNEERDMNPRMHSLIDFNITAGSMVEFVWPATNPIIRANPEMGTVINITSDTQSGQFSMNSDVRIRSGDLYYFERSFFIRQGVLVFRENETKFEPLLTARAELRDRAENGPVTIYMIVDSQPLLNFEPRFESSPSLTQLEIYSILGQNFNLQGSDNPDMAQRMFFSSTADILTQIVATSETLSQLMFFRRIERQIRDILRLDMFSVRTRLLHNAVILGATGLIQDPVDRNYSVGNYFDNTTVFMGKYIGRDIFIHGMLTLRYDENRTALGGLVFEPDIGIEFHTPFLNIRWDFFPVHPENWWVSDHSITLSWSKSF